MGLFTVLYRRILYHSFFMKSYFFVPRDVIHTKVCCFCVCEGCVLRCVLIIRPGSRSKTTRDKSSWHMIVDDNTYTGMVYLYLSALEAQSSPQSELLFALVIKTNQANFKTCFLKTADYKTLRNLNSL